MEVLQSHVLHVALAALTGLCLFLRRVRLPGALLSVFLLVVAVHWGEHIAQLFQIHLLDWPRKEAGGLLGVVFPVLVKREYLHTGFSVIMLAGLLGFRDQFRGTARRVWTVALGIQVFHTFEHLILFTQATAGLNPVSLVQAMLPPGLRPELHLFYNGIVSAPMLAAQVLMVIGGDLHVFHAFYKLGRHHGHPVLQCVRLAWRQAKAVNAPHYWRSAWNVQRWREDRVKQITVDILKTWRSKYPAEKFVFLRSVMGEIERGQPCPNATILSRLMRHEETGERRPAVVRLILTEGLLDSMDALPPAMFSDALAAIVAHEVAHLDRDIRGASAQLDPDSRVEEEEVAADIEGIALAEEAGYSRARQAAVAYFNLLIEREASGDVSELQRRVERLRG